MSADPWVPPDWHVTVTQPWQAPQPPPRPWATRVDGPVALVTAAFVTLMGAAVGLVWAALAPKVDVARALGGNETAFKAQIGADVWFVFVGAAAGLLAAAIALWVVRVSGPGMLLGLVFGGLAGAFVADRVGFLLEHASTLTALRRAGYPHPSAFGVSLLVFRVRALGVVVAWPLASLVLAAAVEMIAWRRR